MQVNLEDGSVNICDLVDIKSVVIDTSLPIQERKKSYVQQIRNPKCYRFDDIIVRVGYSGNGVDFKDRLKQYLLSGQGMELQ